MSGETIAEKAARLLVAGRVTITYLAGEDIQARCVGDSGNVWQLGYRRPGGWFCTCPAREHGRGRLCSHLAGLQLVAGRSARQQRRGDT